MNEELKDAFLCYNKADKEWVEMLGARIEAETIDGTLKSRKVSVFFAEWDIDVGENAVNRMNDGLRQAKYFLPVMTPEFFTSGWTNFEWTHIVAGDPVNLQKRIIPLLLRLGSTDGTERISFPAPFAALNHIDFTDQSQFEKRFLRLLRRLRGLRPERGGTVQPKYSDAGSTTVDEPVESWQADKTRDVLLGNLLEVQSKPSFIWSADTEYVDSFDIIGIDKDVEAHIIREKKIWTFADLPKADCKLQRFVDTKTVRRDDETLWRGKPDRETWYMDIMNKALGSHLSKLAIKKESKGRYFFRPNTDGSARVWQNGSDRPRTVAAKKTNALTGSEFWVHHAARIRFRRFQKRVFLLIEPTFLFTSDGESALGGQQMGSLSIAWGGKQRNPEIVRNMIFWSKAIAGNRTSIIIKTGGDPITVGANPCITTANYGIEDDYIKIKSLLEMEDAELEEAVNNIEMIENQPDDEEEK